MFVLGIYIDNSFPCGLMLFSFGLGLFNLIVLDLIIFLLLKIRETSNNFHPSEGDCPSNGYYPETFPV